VNSLLTGSHANTQAPEKHRSLYRAPRSRDVAGIALALAAAIAFAFATAAARLAYHGGSNPLTIAAVRFLVPMTVLVVWLLLRGMTLKLPLWQRWAAITLGVVTAIYSWALLTAIAMVPIGLAILIFYLFPLITTVILAVCGWGKLAWQTIVAIALAFLGLALVFHPLGSLNIAGVVLAMVAALGVAIVIAVSSRIFGAGDSRRVTLHMVAVAAAILIVICAAQGEFALPQTGVGWLGFIGNSAFYTFAIIGFFIAISMIGPLRVSLLSYAEPVAAAGLGVALLDEKLAPMQILGIAIVIIALMGATVLGKRVQ
jgi:drug/metabolite transporter (DMT)-like permease